ncbi:MAG: nucleotidyltransferase family protein [Gammaproteobacteria bacterium]|nr:nucleotidyltransferase family protein [Gammaproteobacteria bacterium]
MNNPVNAVILAGEGKDSRTILGKSKLHLTINEQPLIVTILLALLDVEGIERICIVGPAEEINKILKTHLSQREFTKPIAVIEQRDNIFENCEAAVAHCVPGFSTSMDEVSPAYQYSTFLLLPVDIPFVTSAELEEFLTNFYNEDLDYAVGMTEESALKKFYPTQQQPGIAPNYLHLREGNFRLNNLHLIRPFQVHNRQFIAKMYTRRHQSNILNIVKTLYDFLITERMGFGPVFFFVYLEMLVLMKYMGFEKILKQGRKLAPGRKVADYTSKLLQAKVAIVETTIGGCATDIDSDEDYEAVQSRYKEWASAVERAISSTKEHK